MNLFATIALATVVFVGGGDEKNDKPKVELRLRPAVSVRGLDVTLADLCEISPLGPDAVAIGQIVFGPAPTNGHARTLQRAEIVQSLAAAGRDIATIKFEGATEIVVQGVVVDVDSTEILAAATGALQALLAVEGGDVEFEAPARLRQVQAPPGRRSQELSARVRGNKTNPESAIVDVDVLVDGTSQKKIPVQFKLQRYRPVLKAIGTIRSGTPLGPDNLVVAREAVTQTSGLFLDSFAQVEGQVAARNLQPQQRVMLGDVSPPALVHKGDIVTVVLTRGRVKVTAKAMANHDAPLTGRITLTNVQTRASLSGVVTGPGLVEVN